MAKLPPKKEFESGKKTYTSRRPLLLKKGMIKNVKNSWEETHIISTLHTIMNQMWCWSKEYKIIKHKQLVEHGNNWQINYDVSATYINHFSLDNDLSNDLKIAFKNSTSRISRLPSQLRSWIPYCRKWMWL